MSIVGADHQTKKSGCDIFDSRSFLQVRGAVEAVRFSSHSPVVILGVESHFEIMGVESMGGKI